MPQPSNYYFASAVFIIVLFFISLKFINRKEAITLYSYALFISAIAWFVLDGGNKIIGLCMFLAAFLERLAKFPKEIGFNKKNEIVFNHFPRKKITWNKN